MTGEFWQRMTGPWDDRPSLRFHWVLQMLSWFSNFSTLPLYYSSAHNICQRDGLWSHQDSGMKIVNSIHSKARQHRAFKGLLEERSAEYGDLLLHAEIRRLSKFRFKCKLEKSSNKKCWHDIDIEMLNHIHCWD